MKKLYAGIAATALAATGIACGAGAAHAGTTGWPSSLDYTPGWGAAMAISSDGAKIYSTDMAIDDSGETHAVHAAVTTVATAATVGRTISVTDDVLAVAPTSTGKVVVLGQDDETGDATVSVADAASGTFTSLAAVAASAGVLAVSPDGDLAAVGTVDGSVETVDLTTGDVTSPVDLAPASDVGGAAIDTLAITDDGVVDVAGESWTFDTDGNAGDSQPWARTVSAAGVAGAATTLQGFAEAVAALPTGMAVSTRSCWGVPATVRVSGSGCQSPSSKR